MEHKSFMTFYKFPVTGYVGWTGMVSMLFILTSRVLGLLGK